MTKIEQDLQNKIFDSQILIDDFLYHHDADSD